jgi:hypothetical protein
LTKPAAGKFNKDKMYVENLLSNDNSFFGICGIVGDAFYYMIQYIGPENEASQLKHKFVLERGAEEIAVCKVASSYNTGVKEVNDRGKCAKFFVTRPKVS